MRKDHVYVFGISLAFIIVAGASIFQVKAEGEITNETVIGDCGTFSPDLVGECCERLNGGRPQILCVGSWGWTPGQGCTFECAV